MRIWDLPPSVLCDKHLLGEHRELHGLFNILTQNKKGYSQHPETKRWVGKTKALYNRHEALAAEITKRRFKHQSPLLCDADMLIGPEQNDVLIESVASQKMLLITKGCKCKVEKT